MPTLTRADVDIRPYIPTAQRLCRECIDAFRDLDRSLSPAVY